MARLQRRILTDEQKRMIVNAYSMRMRQEQIAELLGISFTALRRHLKRDAELREQVSMAKAAGSLKVRQSLYNMATGRKQVIEITHNPKTGLKEERTIIRGRDPDVRALEFWCRTQEGFVSTERHELSGRGGKPIEIEASRVDQVEETDRSKIMAELQIIQTKIAKVVEGD